MRSPGHKASPTTSGTVGAVSRLHSSSPESSTTNTNAAQLASAGPLGGDRDSSSGKSHLVCRHWKTKGWCKYGQECRFAHPDNKRATGNSLVQQVVEGQARLDTQTP